VNAPAEPSLRFGLSAAARRLLTREVRSRPGLFAAVFVGSAVNAFLEVTGLALVFPLLAVIMDPASISMVPGAARVLGALGLTSHVQIIVFFIAAIALTMTAKNVYMVSFYRWQARIVAKWKTELSQRVMRIYVLSDLRLHMEKSTSEMIRNLSFAGLVYDEYLLALLSLIVNGSVAIGVVALLFVALPGATLMGVSALIAGGAVLYVATRHKFTAIAHENNENFRIRSLLLQQAIGAIRESKILGREGYFLDKFGQIEHRSFDRQGYYNFLTLLPALGLETVVVVAMLGIVGHLVFIAGATNGLPTIGLLAAAMFRLLPMTLRIIASLQRLNSGKPTLEVIANEIEQSEPRVRDAIHVTDRLANWSELRLNNVGFSYPDGTVALSGVNAVIKRGEFIGITGPSGSGKTTLMLLILGLIDPTEGTIEVDGLSLADPVTARRWQNGIGYVPQSLFLVDGSIAENVAFGTQQFDRARVAEVLAAAQLTEYVASQSEGIDAPIGDYGERLSGGQKQRVVIARALYRDPDLIAFDEATSTLDVAIERALTDHLAQYRNRKSLIAIAHRLSTIEHCDKVLYLEGGEMKGLAPFAELRAANDNFRLLASLSNL
jgi:ABC-type multidrug transport system fused ATPase/permease subunit